MPRSRRVALGGVALAVAIGAGGCDVESEFIPLAARSANHASGGPPGARAAGELRPGEVTVLDFFAALLENFRGGRFMPIGPGRAAVEEKVVDGPFADEMIEPQVIFDRNAARAAAKRFDISRGRFAARFSGSTDSNTGRASISGIAIARFKSAAAGRACIAFKVNFTDNGTKGTGSFRTIGGTKAAARVRARGIFTETVQRVGTGVSRDADSGRVRATLGKPKRLNAACRTLGRRL